jgi:hypothetical protein
MTMVSSQSDVTWSGLREVIELENYKLTVDGRIIAARTLGIEFKVAKAIKVIFSSVV